MKNHYIEFNEVDYIIPAETYSIEYSYLSKQGFPFTKEFLLRALYISPLSKFELASFFGFNQRELNVAIEEPINKSEVSYLEDGRLCLTALAKGYFSSLEDKPMVEKPQSRTSQVTFELAGFNKVTNQHSGWNMGLRLDVNHEVQSMSEQHARKMFAKHFQRFVESGELGKLKTHDNSLPSLYSVDAVTRKRTIAHRIKRKFEIDFDNKIKPFYVNKTYENDDEISQAISKDTDSLRLGNNTGNIKQAWDAFEDMSVARFIKTDDIDFRGMIAEMGTTTGNKPYELLIGPLYGNQPWTKIEQLLKQLKPTKQQAKIKELSWVGANTRYWGISESFNKSKESLLAYQKSAKGNNYQLAMYLPCDDQYKAKEKAIREWKQKLGNLSSCEGVLNGLFDGSVEVILLENEFAAVSYHISMPDLSPVHIPLGFFTKDKQLVQRISNVVTNFLKGSVAHDKPNLIGSLNTNR
ncbi:hypothetical protein GCM10008107_24980 [Psychrosphaera saromensis]|uniref:Uncharacterized protein n=1 Tax=Psychrosphaera saromensis TaxID=716813 RepID=A0A2S7UWH4_9GAMM|nr:hypothetical protein [Psychrosphaera saromensis]PQJ54287.1 hypothetical protein BTO11_11895 [Psychrosphaera saromensis]GHB74532.1 hypothetical protein GCM10008107_24980 [Psychrosphaera saromensis]GLQ12611.1 hypothetical protein GCM10007917_00660 [Psychrosphaera saromensis]